MDILGHGVDLVDLNKICLLAEDPDGDFVRDCFTETERNDAGDGVRKIERLAGRFAAKEAVLKALGVGWGKGIFWTDVEIHKLASGAPQIALRGRVSEIAKELGVSRWIISISHSETTAVASVIAIGMAV